MKKRRTFTREFKLSILQELESKSAAQICKEQNIHPVLVSSWKRDYEKDPKGAFSGQGNLWKTEAKLAEYERIIGQQQVQIVLLKKTSKLLQERKAEEKRKWSK